jgi:hypothetical protein
MKVSDTDLSMLLHSASRAGKAEEDGEQRWLLGPVSCNALLFR